MRFSPLVVCVMLPPFCTNCALFQSPEATVVVASDDTQSRFLPIENPAVGECSPAPDGAQGCFVDTTDGQVCCGKTELSQMEDGSQWGCIYAFCRDECDDKWSLREFECARAAPPTVTEPIDL